MALCGAGALAACGSSNSSSSSATSATGTTTSKQAATGVRDEHDVRVEPRVRPPHRGPSWRSDTSAKVAFTPAGSTNKSKASTLQLTVQSFDKGSLSDFNGIQLDATEKASTPYYVKVHVTNLGPANIDVDSSAAAIEGVDSTGNNQSSVTFIGDFPKCPDAASTKPLGTGKGYDDCLTFLVPGGIKRVSYNGTSDYIDSPVTWGP